MSTPETPFAVSLEVANGAVVVRIAGELDISTAPELRDRLREALGANAKVVVDLGSLSFLDSSGISVLIAAHKQAAATEHAFVLRGAAGQIAEVLHVSGVDQVFTMEDPGSS